MTAPARIAVVGAGIAGLSAAWHLAREAAGTHVTLFEADERFGGHAHTVDLTLDGVRHGVDTGFLVFNERTYPGLIGLFDALGVETAGSDMSFSVQSPAHGLEWSGSDLGGVFAQRRNLLSPRFLAMLAEILRFNRLATGIAERGDDAALSQSVGAFLAAHRFGRLFRDAYFLPMIGSIWSCPTEQMLAFPVGTLIRFCHNHGLLQVNDRPRWFTVAGGSQAYVQKMLAALPDTRRGAAVRAVRRLPPGPHGGQAGVRVETDHGSERFDAVVLATHAPQALAMLPDAGADERAVLGAIRTQPNRAVLHTDERLLPRARRAWAAWNYEAALGAGVPERVCLHYLINRLQPLPWRQPVIVSLNPLREPDPARVHGEFSYAHPVFDQAAIAAQRRLPGLQGRGGVWFCGAWTRYGFHEDGFVSGQAVARALAQRADDAVARRAGTVWPEAA
jgi:predicted NAD/FAD-binding protein